MDKREWLRREIGAWRDEGIVTEETAVWRGECHPAGSAGSSGRAGHASHRPRRGEGRPAVLQSRFGGDRRRYAKGLEEGCRSRGKSEGELDASQALYAEEGRHPSAQPPGLAGGNLRISKVL